MTSWPPMARRGHEITVDNVRRFERQLGAALPEDYRAFLLELNGGRTARSHRAFVMQRAGRRDETTLDTLHSLDDPDEDHDLAARQLYSRDDYPENGLCIGDDAFGSAIVLILTGPHRGEVWMLDQVEGRPTGSNPRVEWFDRRDVWQLAGNFTEFMGSLRPLDEAGAGTSEARQLSRRCSFRESCTKRLRTLAAGSPISTGQESIMATNWIPIADPGPRVTEDDVRRFEREFGYELPADYRAFLLDVNGGYAPSSHCVFRLRTDETVLNSLFSLNATDDRDDLATAQKHYSPDAMLPEGLLEIGYDDGGGRIVLSLAGPHRGEVWYVDIENPRPTGSNPRVEWFDRRDVKRVASSFREFVDGLRPIDDGLGASASP